MRTGSRFDRRSLSSLRAASRSTLAARAARAERETARKEDSARRAKREPVRIEPAAAPIVKSDRAKRETQIPLFTGAASEGELPPLSLLEEAQPQSGKGYS
ncbi:MAG: hypothetical protein ACREPZ_14095, partial [Rhodanobacteraceae bacterium]